MKVWSFALAGGIVWGYGPSFVGGIIGGIYGFFDGLIGAALIAWLYNVFAASRR